MGRSPNLKVGHLYLIKNRDESIDFEMREYSTLIGYLDKTGLMKDIYTELKLTECHWLDSLRGTNESEIYLDFKILASNDMFRRPGEIFRLHGNHRAVFQKFNPKILPVCMDWYWNEWVINQLKGVTNETITSTEQPAPASQSPQP